MASRPIPGDLLPWALDLLPSDAGERVSFDMIAGDASNRRYFRLVTQNGGWIVADAPPATEKNQEFIAIRSRLAGLGVRVPDVYGVDIQRGYLLLEDLGDQTLLPLLNNVDTASDYYRQTWEILFALARPEAVAGWEPEYDLALLTEELSRFDEWFVGALLEYSLSDQERVLIEDLKQLLIDSALQQPQVLVHRDFHSRNLMLCPGNELALIDFQDSVRGPVTYDLASLLRDCYICWPAKHVRRWLLDYREALIARGLMAPIEEEQFIRWFDWMGLQRHIKVLGTFARLYLRDGKLAYLQDLPLVLRYIEETLENYAREEPVFSGFLSWFRKELSPVIAQQGWSQSQ